MNLQQFKPDSHLHRYLVNKHPLAFRLDQPVFLLINILCSLKRIILIEQLFDPQNYVVVLCNPSLDAALRVRAFHISHLAALVLTQSDTCVATNVHITPALSNEWSQWPLIPFTSMLYKVISALAPSFDKTANYWVKPGLLKIFRTLPGFNHLQVVYPYPTILQSFHRYLYLHNNNLIDPRYGNVAIIKNDALGEVLGVSAIDECQIEIFVRFHLEKFNTDHPFAPLDYTKV